MEGREETAAVTVLVVADVNVLVLLDGVEDLKRRSTSRITFS